MSIMHFQSTISAATIVGEGIIVTEGSIIIGPDTVYGFRGAGLPSSTGSVSPTTLNGETIASLAYISTNVAVVILANGLLASSFFTDVTFQDGSTLTSASATFIPDVLNGISSWSWSDTRPSRWDGSGTSTVIFTLP